MTVPETPPIGRYLDALEARLRAETAWASPRRRPLWSRVISRRMRVLRRPLLQGAAMVTTGVAVVAAVAVAPASLGPTPSHPLAPPDLVARQTPPFAERLPADEFYALPGPEQALPYGVE